MADDKSTRVDDFEPSDTERHLRRQGIVPAPAPVPDDSSYQLGEVDIKDDRPVVRTEKARRTSVAWLLLVLVLGAATYFGLRQYLPLTDDLADSKAKLVEAQKQVAGLADEVKNLQSSQAELAAQVAKRDAELQALQTTQDELIGKLQSEIDQGNVAVKQSQGQIVVDLVDKILFPSGAADLSDPGKEILRQVGETFLKVPDKVIQIGGHTDAVPISPKLKDRFASNWELSAARALNVVHYLQDEIKVPGERLAAAGLAEFRPTASNKTPAGRQKNRRIEVVLLPLVPTTK